MTATGEQASGNWVATLRRFAGPQALAKERCELCSALIGREHDHIVERETRVLLCACAGCAMLFDSPDAKRYRRVPRDVERLDDFELPDATWDAFLIPINMAFFVRGSVERRVVAMYPGPAGGTESTLDLAAWSDLENDNPVLRSLGEDVEALLVNRIGGAREYYRVPLDRCYELIGVIRQSWHGLSGGDGVRDAIRDFFDALRAQCGKRGSKGGNGADAHA